MSINLDSVFHVFWRIIMASMSNTPEKVAIANIGLGSGKRKRLDIRTSSIKKNKGNLIWTAEFEFLTLHTNSNHWYLIQNKLYKNYTTANYLH